MQTTALSAQVFMQPASRQNSDQGLLADKPLNGRQTAGQPANPNDSRNQKQEVGSADIKTAANETPLAGRAQGRDTVSINREDQQLIKQLAARDREVRAHEAAHSAVAGRYAGRTSYTYEKGPDGVLYAVGGEVSLDVGPVDNDPEATLNKAERIQAAALAPAQPSSTDRSVAAQAAGMASAARAELLLTADQRAKASAAYANTTGNPGQPTHLVSSGPRQASAASDQPSPAERAVSIYG
ncbi:MAG: hypothetical protein A2521_01055 [Deltaproteobacteria bacterium RIFOXYD12_FULL_57_12]|nr:MAG: hypothetical protein A2521_01055 [Deltaproteobacteria bacterium RIFOXYD12_FULL_57_12]